MGSRAALVGTSMLNARRHKSIKIINVVGGLIEDQENHLELQANHLQSLACRSQSPELQRLSVLLRVLKLELKIQLPWWQWQMHIHASQEAFFPLAGTLPALYSYTMMPSLSVTCEAGYHVMDCMDSHEAPGKGLTSLVSALGPDARVRLPICIAPAEFATRRAASAAASWLDASERDVAAGAGAAAPLFPVKAAATWFCWLR